MAWQFKLIYLFEKDSFSDHRWTFTKSGMRNATLVRVRLSVGCTGNCLQCLLHVIVTAMI